MGLHDLLRRINARDDFTTVSIQPPEWPLVDQAVDAGLIVLIAGGTLHLTPAGEVAIGAD